MQNNSADLSRQLALALGYHPESVRIIPSDIGPENDECQVFRVPTHSISQDFACWLLFEYTDPTVVVQLIKWLMVEHGAFPTRTMLGDEFTGFMIRGAPQVPDVSWLTLELAVARAVIAVGVKHA